MDPYTAPAVQEVDDIPDIELQLSKCPVCGETMELCFTSSENVGYIPSAKVGKSFVLFGERLRQRSFWDQLFEIRILSRFYISHLCRGCSCYVVDGRREFTLPQVRRVIAQHSNGN